MQAKYKHPSEVDVIVSNPYFSGQIKMTSATSIDVLDNSEQEENVPLRHKQKEYTENRRG